MKRQGILITWVNLHLSTKNRIILNKETGSIDPNSFVAILGPIGSGKSSFLNALAGRSQDHITTNGSIYANHEEREFKSWKNNVSYVQHLFYAYEKQTVYETLYLCMTLKNESTDVEKCINEVLYSLDLYKLKDVLLDQLSYGEFKKVAISTELVCNPRLLFLDEPTSGLDSFNAINLINTLKKLSEKMTIVITIDQPTYVMMKTFTELIIISGGGFLFQGNHIHCEQFFEECGYYPPKNINPYDYYMEILAVNPFDSYAYQENTVTIKFLKEMWDSKKNLILNVTKTKFNEEQCGTTFKNEVFFFFKNLSKLIYRNIIEHWRNKKLLKVQISQKIFLIIVLGLTFLHLEFKESSIQSRTGVISFILINSFYGTASPILIVFPLEKKIIVRERNAGYYNGFTAYLAKIIATACFDLPIGFIYGSSIYWLVNLNPNAGRFALFLLILESGIFFAISFGYTIGSISPTEKIALILGTTTFIFYVLYGGSFTNPETIPSWLYWVLWISPVNYYYRALMINQYQGIQIGGASGDELLVKYGLNGPSLWANIFGLWGFTLLYLLIGGISLHIITSYRLKLKY